MRLVGVKCTANSAKKVLKVIDTDGSGEIELDEFLVFFKKATRDRVRAQSTQTILPFRHRVRPILILSNSFFAS